MIQIPELKRALKRLFLGGKARRRKPLKENKKKRRKPSDAQSANDSVQRSIRLAFAQNIPATSLSQSQSNHDAGPRLDARSALQASAYYLKIPQFREADLTLGAALRKDPDHLPLLKAHAEIAMLRRAWSDAAARWEKLLHAASARPDALELQIDALCGQLASARAGSLPGDYRNPAKTHFDRHTSAWKKHLPFGYAIFPVFQQKTTRIDYHIKVFDLTTGAFVRPGLLTITFDTRHIGWGKDSFALKALRQREIDILAVRKHRSGDTHQDLDRRDFLEVAGGINSSYKDCVALGSSLGGYLALYFAAHLPNCRVLAMSPRNSLNPKYGPPRFARLSQFYHEYDMPCLPDCRPTILHDPKEPRDRIYIGSSIKISFPNARYLPYPYCGHSMPDYLVGAGVLKNAVLGFCAGEAFPEFDRSLRRRSAAYWRNLAKLNLMAGRPNWAKKLAEQAVRVGGRTESSEKLLKRIVASTPSTDTHPPRGSKSKRKKGKARKRAKAAA